MAHELHVTTVIKTENFQGLGQSIAYTATAASSAALPSDVPELLVLLLATTDCFYSSTVAGTDATSSDTFLPAATQTLIAVTPGHIISVIQDSVSGTLHISPASPA